MDIRVLLSFLAVAREESITRAAESLHLSQPSLSKQLQELERELGKTLLIRGRRKITLTQEGVLLRKRADEIVSLLEKTERELGTEEAGLSGEIAIGGSPTDRVLRAAVALRQEHPGVRFHFYSSDATDITERLDHGTLDFAILLEPVDTMKYDGLPLGDSSRWGLLLPAGHPLAAKETVGREELLSVPLIFYRRPGLQRQIALWAGTEPEHMNIAATYNVVNGSPTPFVRSGLGCFLANEGRLDRPDPDVCFRPLSPPLELHHALVWKRYSVFSRVAEAFLERVRREMQDRPPVRRE